MSKKRRLIAEELIISYLQDSDLYPTASSINNGSCADFARILNETYVEQGFSEHRTFCTYDFISPTIYTGVCEYLDFWRKDSMLLLGISPEYFKQYKKRVKSVDKRGVVGYHVWLFDGEHHYDAECLDGVKNPLELPFFQSFLQ